MSWVLESSKSRLAARLVLLAIANHANQNGEQAWPSVPTLAREAHISVRQAQRAVLDLVALGEVVIHMGAGPGKTNVYRVVMGGDKMSPPLVTFPTVSGDISGSAIRKNRPEPPKPTPPCSPPLKGGTISNRQVDKILKALAARYGAWVGLGKAELERREIDIIKSHGCSPDAFYAALKARQGE